MAGQPADAAPPVLLVHGLASSFEHNWRQNGWVDLLADAGREVLAVDLPGHGSAQGAAGADLEQAVLAALPGDGPVDAVGFSLGARALLGAAADAPGRFGRLVVGGVGANLFADADHEPLAAALEAGDPGAPGLLGLFVRFAAGSGNDPRALATVLRAPAPPMTAERLGRIASPVLVVLGERDFVGPPDQLVAALPDARLRTLRGVDHFGTPKDFGFLDAALTFLGAA